MDKVVDEDQKPKNPVVNLSHLLPNINGKIVIEYMVDNGYSVRSLNIIAVDRYLINWSKSSKYQIVLTEEGLQEVAKVIGKIELDGYHLFKRYDSGILTIKLP